LLHGFDSSLVSVLDLKIGTSTLTVNAKDKGGLEKTAGKD